eukprot:765343-Hanusia_phi.AAC.5
MDRVHLRRRRLKLFEEQGEIEWNVAWHVLRACEGVDSDVRNLEDVSDGEFFRASWQLAKKVVKDFSVLEFSLRGSRGNGKNGMQGWQAEHLEQGREEGSAADVGCFADLPVQLFYMPSPYAISGTPPPLPFHTHPYLPQPKLPSTSGLSSRPLPPAAQWW